MDRTWRRESSGCTGRCSKAAIGRSRRGAATNLKADGSKRALGIAALEDKIVQHALATVLGAIFAVPGNLQRLAGFRRAVCRAWLQALRSRSQLARLPWSRFARLVALFIPLVRQLHLYHNAFASLLKARAVCGNAASTDPCGGSGATPIPTATGIGLVHPARSELIFVKRRRATETQRKTFLVFLCASAA